MKHIYIYETPESKKMGLLKIGDATDVDSRIREQLNTAGAFEASKLQYTLLYRTEAKRADGAEFRDHDIHALLEQKGYFKHQITEDNVTIKSKTEWFTVDLDKVVHLIESFKAGKRIEEIDIERFQSFPMRPEQQRAVDQTLAYFEKHKDAGLVEALWNAKMRFGKTFTAYQLAKKANYSKVLVLTYKPAVEDAWQKDLDNHLDFKDYVFLKREGLLQINRYLSQSKKVVAFASYQDLLGTQDESTDIKAKHKELFETQWDLVVVDEFHYGASTKKAKEMLADMAQSKAERKELEEEFFAEEDAELEEEQATEQIVEVVEKAIKSPRRLYLSGTPFRAIADSKFEREAIFNWTYTDEQKAKEQWNKDHPSEKHKNPYRGLPQIQMYLYKVSEDLLKAGMQEGKDEFSLNHFFKARRGAFLNPEPVKKWLDLISGRIVPHVEVADEIREEVQIVKSQYPFDQAGQLHQGLDHTLWYLNRVDSAYAMAKMLKEHPIFNQYHIILAAGKGLGSGVDAVQPVLDAIDANAKTITLTVGKLTTGVSIPKWKAVVFLRDTESPENYFQTAFRAQTPYTDKLTGAIKEVCYIFDFSPNRSLKLLTSYSEKLTSDSTLTTSEEKISEFIRYLPVLKVQGNQMVSMDARDVLTFDLSGIDAKGLGERFIEKKNVVVTRETIDAIGESPETQARCQAIFEKIKMFKRFTGASDDEMKKSDANVAELDVNNGRVKKLESKEPKDPEEKKKHDKELDAAEKDLKSEREKVRELLRTLLSRIPIFMYLTDATEENLEQVLIETKHDLFRKATGITIDDFRFLKDIGLIRVDSLDGYILKFLQLENQNYDLVNTA